MKISRLSMLAAVAAAAICTMGSSCDGSSSSDGQTKCAPIIKCGPGTGEVNGVCMPTKAVKSK